LRQSNQTLKGFLSSLLAFQEQFYGAFHESSAQFNQFANINHNLKHIPIHFSTYSLVVIL